MALARKKLPTEVQRMAFNVSQFLKAMKSSGQFPEGKGVFLKTVNDIPYGHNNPMQRPSNVCEDRQLRMKIEKANNDGDCIINVGNGYYRPVPGDTVDEKELDEYLAKELHRARAIQKKRLSMKMAFERRREVGILTNNTRAAE